MPEPNSSVASRVMKNKALFSNMSLEEKRKHYKCGSNYIALENVPTWASRSENNKFDINEKVSLFRADITRFEIDAIVNAANQQLRGGGGVDGCIHQAACIEMLLDETSLLGGCLTGEAKITCGYKLPARHIIHTVGPCDGSAEMLERCYENCIQVAVQNGIRTIAFPCISTGIYGFDQYLACNIALATIRRQLNKHSDQIDRVIFCPFLDEDNQIYNQNMSKHFPFE